MEEPGQTRQRETLRRRHGKQEEAGSTQYTSETAPHKDTDYSGPIEKESKGGIATYIDLDNLDMLRSLLCLWILLFHSLCFMAAQMTDGEGYDIIMVCEIIIQTSFFRIILYRLSLCYFLSYLQGWIYGGFIAVDGFLVLTGFLVAMPYVKLNPKSTVVGTSFREKFNFVLQQHQKRFVRIVPSLVVVLTLHCYISYLRGGLEGVRQRQLSNQITLNRLAEKDPTQPLGSNCESSWGPLLFVNNLQPFGGTLIHLWSLAVQYQFYILLPVIHVCYNLSRGKNFVKVALGFTVAAVLFRSLSFFHYHSFRTNSLMRVLFNFHTYAFTLNRVYSIWIGGLAAWVIDRYPCVTEWLRRPSASSLILQSGLLVFGGFYYYTNSVETDIGVSRRFSYTLLVQAGSLGSSIVWCYAIYLVGAKDNILRQMSTVGFQAFDTLRKQRLWKKIAQLSYIIFLIHPTVFTQLYNDHRLLMPHSRQSVPVPVVILKDGVSTVSTISNNLVNGTTSQLPNYADTYNLAKFKDGLSPDMTAFLDDDGFEQRDEYFHNMAISRWKMIERLEYPVSYSGPTIPGTRSITKVEFVLYTWIAMLIAVLLSDVLRFVLIDPLTNFFRRPGNQKWVQWLVGLHSSICIILSVCFHVFWVYTAARYVRPEIEETHPVGQINQEFYW